MKKLVIPAVVFLALCSCATQPETQTKTAAAPPRQTEMRTMEIDTQPEGAAININGYNKGYSPVSIIVPVYTDDNTLADGYYVTAVPTLPGEYTQTGMLWPGLSPANSIIFYMYNTAR